MIPGSASWDPYLWCLVAVGEAVEVVEEGGEGIFDSGMPAGTVH